MIPQPLFVLGPQYGEASRVAAMLGSHPGALLVPELHLTIAETVSELFDIAEVGRSSIDAGMLRVVAELFFGGQGSNETAAARQWLHRRADWTLDQLLWALAEHVAPRQLVVPDSSAPWRPDTLTRLDAMFADAPWLVVLSHPRLYCNVVHTRLKTRLFVPSDFRDNRIDPPLLDPQLTWLRVQLNLDHAAAARARRAVAGAVWEVRTELLFAEPEAVLRNLCDWLGWRATDADFAAMMAPERSPFAWPGPPEAIGGLDESFMQSPLFERRIVPLVSLEGPLEWRPDGLSFGEELRVLAQQHGYR